MSEGEECPVESTAWPTSIPDRLWSSGCSLALLPYWDP